MKRIFKWKSVSKEIEISKNLSFSWIFVWSLSYIVCAFIKPDIIYGVPYKVSIPFNLGFGLLLLVALIFDRKTLLFISGIIEVFGGVSSWVGLVKWNVPWAIGYDPLAQISMAILDLVTAAFLLHCSFKQFELRRPYHFL